MAVDFSFSNIIYVISEFFGGNTTVGGLAVMMAVSLIIMAILANIKAPIQYSLAPMILLSIIFAAMGIMNTTVSFIIIIVCAVILASTARRLVGGN